MQTRHNYNPIQQLKSVAIENMAKNENKAMAFYKVVKQNSATNEHKVVNQINGGNDSNVGQTHPWVVPLGTSHPNISRPLQFQDNIGFT
jgi:hypothetical protein